MRLNPFKLETLPSAVLRGLAWLHCGLVAGLLCAAAFSLLAMLAPMPLSAQAAFWRGLLFALPAGLCFYAIKRQPALWQFLLTSLLLCALCWPLMGHPGGPVMMALMCLFRLRARLAEEEDGPVQSLFDRPLLPALGLFAAAWFFSAVLGLSELQRLSLLGGVLYLLVCLCHHGLARVVDYLQLNQGMSGLPARRIWRIAGAAALGAVVLAGLFLLPAALADPGHTRISLPEQRIDPNADLQMEAPEQPVPGNNGGMEMDLAGMFGEPAWHIPEWVSYLLFGVIGLILLAALFAGVRGLFLNFRRSYTDSRDLIQSLAREDRDQARQLEPALARPRLWDRSHAAAVRRRYRRAILKGTREQPNACHTPAELEDAARLSDPALHEEYERVRYGKSEG